MRNERPSDSARKAQIRAQVARDVPVEVPVGGWNTRDAADNIPQTDAIIMDNWIPGIGEVAVRRGKRPHSYIGGDETTPPTDVPTLAVYNSGAVNKMLAFSDGKVYDVSSEGPSVELTVEPGTTIQSDIFQFTNFRGSIPVESGGLLILCNGANEPLMYGHDNPSFVEDVGPVEPALSGSGWSGVPVGCHSFKNRMYYWQAQSQSVWYTELYAPGGTITRFPLGAVGQFGGSLIGMYTWTHDGGSGPDDYAVFVMSSGEILVYQGEYPGSLSDWAIIGIYNIGTPLHNRGAVKFGGDLIIMTDLDFVFLSNAILGVEANKNLTKISGAIQRAAGNIGQFGWDAVMYPLRKYLIFNVPSSTDYVQFVMNTVTGAWCRLTGLHALSWALYDGEVYFGSTDGVVYKAFSGNYDVDYQWITGTFSRTFSFNDDPADPAKPFSPGEIAQSVAVDVIEISTSDFYGDPYPTSSIQVGQTIRVEKDASNYKEYDVTGISSSTGEKISIIFSLGSSSGTISHGDLVELKILDIQYTYAEAVVPIEAEIQTAWLNFGAVENKIFKALKNYFRSPATVLYESAFATDFASFKFIPYTISDETSSTPWGSPWGSPWSAQGKVSERWENIAGYGRVVSMKMRVSMKSALSWELSIWHIEVGSAM